VQPLDRDLVRATGAAAVAVGPDAVQRLFDVEQRLAGGGRNGRRDLRAGAVRARVEVFDVPAGDRELGLALLRLELGELVAPEPALLLQHAVQPGQAGGELGVGPAGGCAVLCGYRGTDHGRLLGTSTESRVRVSAQRPAVFGWAAGTGGPRTHRSDPGAADTLRVRRNETVHSISRVTTAAVVAERPGGAGSGSHPFRTVAACATGA
jgi:hypothetical protein